MAKCCQKLAAFILMCWAGSLAAQSAPLRAGVDPNFPPHAFPKPGGGYQGFNIDLGNEIARRLVRAIEFEGAQFSALIPALNAKKFDFLMAPMTASPERAQLLLMTEGYLENNRTVIVRSERNDLHSLSDFKGKRIAVNKGSTEEQWLRLNQAQYGYEIAAYGTNTDAVQAVISGRADGNFAGITASAWAVKSNPAIKMLPIIKTNFVWVIPFRIDDKAGRDQVSYALKCIKQDGTLLKIYEKWLNHKPEPDSVTMTSPPGHGVSGLPGYDPTPVALRCD